MTGLAFVGLGGLAFMVTSAFTGSLVVGGVLGALAGGGLGKAVHAAHEPVLEGRMRDVYAASIGQEAPVRRARPKPEWQEGVFTREQWQQAAQLDRERAAIATQYGEWMGGSMDPDFATWRMMTREGVRELEAHDQEAVALASAMGAQLPESRTVLFSFIQHLQAQEAEIGHTAAFSDDFHAMMAGIRGERKADRGELVEQAFSFKEYVDHRRNRAGAQRGQYGDVGDYFKAWYEALHGVPMSRAEIGGVGVARSWEGLEIQDGLLMQGDRVVVGMGVHVGGNHFRSLALTQSGYLNLDSMGGCNQMELPQSADHLLAQLDVTIQDNPNPFILTVSREQHDRMLAGVDGQWVSPRQRDNNCYLATAAVLSTVLDVWSD